MLRLTVVPILAATVWIAVSEFVRNEILLKSLWVDHYAGLGMAFPSAPVNGAIWGLWSLALALLIHSLLRRFSPLSAGLLAWFAGFVMMWIVIGNMGVLPYGILPYALPLSLLEVALAVLILDRLGAAQRA